MDTPLLGLIVYLIVMFLVGLYTWGKNESKEDFIVAGRRLGGFVISLSERTAAESSWLLLGLSGALFTVGLGEVWTVIGCVTGIILSWVIIARRLRVLSEHHGAITLPEYFYKRVGGRSSAVRVVSMLIILFFFSFYVAAQFVGAGKVLNVTFGINPLWGMVLGGAVIVIYTLMGGFLAVCLTDVVQALLMITTLVVMPIVGLLMISRSGLDIGAALRATGHTASLVKGHSGFAAVAWVVGGLSWGLGYMGQPHLVTKFMAIRSPDDVRGGRTIAIIWTVLAYGGALLIGLVGITLMHAGRIDLMNMVAPEKVGELLHAARTEQLAAVDPERILPVLAFYILPAWIAGILISGAVAAMMSTADSQLLVATSTLVEDFYAKALGKELTPRKMVVLSRVVTLGVGAAAFVLALASKNLIYKMVSYAWAGLGSAFGPALLATLYWRKTSSAGVVAGMITGALTTIVWTEFEALDKLISVRLVAFALASVAVVVGSLFAPRTDDGPTEPEPASESPSQATGS